MPESPSFGGNDTTKMLYSTNENDTASSREDCTDKAVEKDSSELQKSTRSKIRSE